VEDFSRQRPAVGSTDLLLSAVEIRLTCGDFQGYEAPYPGDKAFDDLRQRKNELFAYRHQDKPEEKRLIIIPLRSDVEITGYGPLHSLPIKDHLRAIATLIQTRLPSLSTRTRCVPATTGPAPLAVPLPQRGSPSSLFRRTPRKPTICAMRSRPPYNWHVRTPSAVSSPSFLTDSRTMSLPFPMGWVPSRDWTHRNLGWKV
jgi:hypothetical protein